jgi:phosphoribosyl 1,2-cyclic phosphodiesterase
MLRFRVLGSGSSGNTTLVEGDGTRILIDAGLGPRELAERLSSVGVDAASISAVFVSHEHTDHSRGAAGFSRKWAVRLCGTSGTYAAAGLGAAEIEGYDVLEPGVPRRVGNLTVLGVPVPHDAAGPLAFVVSCDGRSLGHATDFGHIGRGLAQAFRRCDAILIESNYDPDMLRDGPYPWSLKQRILSGYGHLSNMDTARYLGRDLGEACRLVVLAHLSQQNNHPEVALMAAEAALRRRGRTEVRVEATGPEGTDWLDVGAMAPPAKTGPKQLRLF